MAKRHTDTRFIVQAIPSLFRLTGKYANQELRAAMDNEKCACGNPALLTRSENTNRGLVIKRFCLECINREVEKTAPALKVAKDDPVEIVWSEPVSFAERLLYPHGKPEHTGGFPNGPLQHR